MKKILCYGDSNTFGRRSDKGRFSADERRTDLLQRSLWDEYKVINEWMNSRTLVGEDPRGRSGLNGRDSFIPTIEKHQPIDLLIRMLGTNQCKEQFNLSPETIAILAEEHFFKFIAWENIPTIIIPIPPIVEVDALDYEWASVKPPLINETYKECAERYGFQFLDIYHKMKVWDDGVHLTKETHKIIADALLSLIKHER